MNVQNGSIVAGGLGVLSILIAMLLLAFTVRNEGEPTAVALSLLVAGIGLAVFAVARRRTAARLECRRREP